MRRKNIWWIVGLMSAAVIGLAAIQIYWLSYFVKLNEAKFDESIRSTLLKVKNQLEEYDAQYESYSDRGFLNRKKNSDLKITSELRKSRSLLQDTSDLAFLEQDIGISFANAKRYINKDISERIDVEKLNMLLKNELESSSIPIRYDYAIYSEELQDFVIANGHYLTPIGDDVKASTVQMPSERMTSNLRYSQYSILLFNNGLVAPGALVLHFPDRTSHIWRNIMPMLLLTVLFMSVILFAFIYSLNVIFRQKKLSEMKNDFINNMTHEFKTPIATISLATDSIMSDKIAGSKEKVGRFAKIIKQENRRMLGQVEKVLQMAQIDKNVIQLNWDQVDVHNLIYLAYENFQLVVHDRGGELTLDLKAERSVIRSDQNHLSNVIHNLLDNANKYSPEKPNITISSKNVSQGIEITISDEGQGMSKENKKHIFDKFYRVHTGNRHDVKGFGLGLSYVKAMVMAHQGTIQVKSEIDKGSSFILFFPFENKEK
jgi:two-component system phosphate regulon sensor histidine kinase PhoR